MRVFNNWVTVLWLQSFTPPQKKPLQICPPPSRSLIGRCADWPLSWLAESFLLALRVEPSAVVWPAAEVQDGVSAAGQRLPSGLLAHDCAASWRKTRTVVVGSCASSCPAGAFNTRLSFTNTTARLLLAHVFDLPDGFSTFSTHFSFIGIYCAFFTLWRYFILFYFIFWSESRGCKLASSRFLD